MQNQELIKKCESFIYSKGTPEEKRKATKYASEKLGSPDKNSQFEKELGKIKYLFKIPFINEALTYGGLWYLEKKGYDALVLELERKIIGHTAFQTHQDNSLHIFSVEVLEQYRGKGLATYMIQEVIAEARKKEIDKVRIGGGKNKITNRIHQNMSKLENELNILVKENNWIQIEY